VQDVAANGAGQTEAKPEEKFFVTGA